VPHQSPVACRVGHGVPVPVPDRAVRQDVRVTKAAASSRAVFPTVRAAVARAASFPRLRYMGSKYKLVPQLAEVFAAVGGKTVLDAFSGSGVVAYALKGLGYQVTANDFLHFPSVIASATVQNEHDRLGVEDADLICLAPAADDRDFIQRTFDGLYFTAADRAFLDAAWSHIDQMAGFNRDLAISALVLAVARRQPRGVFTFTDHRYDDGRRDLRISLREHFRECVARYNSVVFASGESSRKHSAGIRECSVWWRCVMTGGLWSPVVFGWVRRVRWGRVVLASMAGPAVRRVGRSAC
jgi:adenine-specific DNA-methyltransferase